MMGGHRVVINLYPAVKNVGLDQESSKKCRGHESIHFKKDNDHDMGQ